MSKTSPGSVSMILRHPPDAASSRVRGLEMAQALSARGTRVRVAHPGQRSWKIRGLWLGLFSRIALFQKRWGANDRRLLKLRHTLGRPSVFDLDDAPGTVHESPEQERRVAQMMRLASAVTVGNHALHDFATRHNDNVRLIPSAVDTDVFEPRARTPTAPVTIGWIGNGPGYWQDLVPLAAVLARIRPRRRVRAVIVGAMGHPEIHSAFAADDDVVIDAVDWTNNVAIVDAMQSFDIGVYPLGDTAYNAYKCGYKAIQYMALGVPVVSSPTGENRHVVTDGETGLLAATEEQWHDCLLRLLEDDTLRERLGRAGRESVVQRYSLATASRLLADLLAELTGGDSR